MERASRQVSRRRRVLEMKRCVPLARLFPANVANVTQFLPLKILPYGKRSTQGKSPLAKPILSRRAMTDIFLSNKLNSC